MSEENSRTARDIDPEFESLPEVKRFRKIQHRVDLILEAIRYTTMGVLIIQLISYAAGRGIPLWIILIINIPILIALVVTWIIYEKEDRRYADVINEFYAQKLGTTPEKLRAFDRDIVNGVYGGDYDQTLKDLKYIQEHPLLFDDKGDDKADGDQPR